MNEKKTPRFYPLTNQEWGEIFPTLTKAELGTLFYVRTLDPFGDRSVDVNSTVIAEVLDLDRSTVSRALKKLDRLNLIDLEIITAKASSKAVNTKKSPLCVHTHPVRTDTDTVRTDTDTVRTDTDTVRTDTDTVRTDTDTVRTDTIEELEPAPDNGSGTPQTLEDLEDLEDSLSDQEEDKDKLTVESTKVVGEENMEGERENFSAFSEEENSEEEVETKIEVEQDLNSSASLSKEDQPQIKPKNLSSRGQGFGACSTKSDKNIRTTMPKTFKKLKRDFSYSEADCKEFEEFVHKKVAHFNPPLANYDDYLRSRLQGLVNDFDKTRAKKADSKRVTYVVVEAEDMPKKEPIKRSKSVKQIMAEIQEQKLKEKAEKQND